MAPQAQTSSIQSAPAGDNARRIPHTFPVHSYGFVGVPGSPVERYRSAKAADSTRLNTGQDIGSRFGRRLRELRQERSLTQSEMARKFGIDRSFISDVERGRKSISLGLLEVIALGLKVSLSDLFRDL